MVKVSVSGYNQLAVLSGLTKKNISIRSLKRKDAKTMSFIIKGKAQAVVKEYLKRFNCEAQFQSFGFWEKLKSLSKRFGCLVGIAVAMVPFVYFSGRILKVEVTGNVRFDDKVIISALSEQGIKVYSGNKVDTNKIVGILVNMPQFVAASCEMRGCVLSVNVMEATVVDCEQSGDSIVCLYDCEITEVITECGTALVKPGDRVPMGSTLIEGVEYSSNGEPIRSVKAKGIVYGKVSFSFDTVKPLKDKIKTIEKSQLSLYLFGKKIIGNEMSGNDIMRSRNRLWSFLPIYVVRETLYGYDYKEILPEQALDAAVKEGITALAIKHRSPSYSVTTYHKEDNGFIKVNVQITAEISVGGIK